MCERGRIAKKSEKVSSTMRSRRQSFVARCALVTLLMLSVGAVTGIRQHDRDDMTVEEMLRRESRDVDGEQPGPTGPLPAGDESGVSDETALPVVVRSRQGRTRQIWRHHRPRHSGRQGAYARSIRIRTRSFDLLPRVGPRVVRL